MGIETGRETGSSELEMSFVEGTEKRMVVGQPNTGTFRGRPLPPPAFLSLVS